MRLLQSNALKAKRLWAPGGISLRFGTQIVDKVDVGASQRSDKGFRESYGRFSTKYGVVVMRMLPLSLEQRTLIQTNNSLQPRPFAILGTNAKGLIFLSRALSAKYVTNNAR
jgi:hypothetical protein